MNPDSSGNLENEVGELRSRVRRIEEALRRRGVVLEEAETRRATEPASASRTVPPHLPAAATVERAGPAEHGVPAPALGDTPLARPMFGITGAAKAEMDRSLESRIGSQWFNRIGILAVLIAMAWFLKMAIDNHWIGPLGRVLIGLVAGAGLIGWSERFRNRGYAGFSYSLKAVGTGILYLSLWAAFSLFHLLPAGAAFAAMILVTAFNGFMAWVQDAELLALYAIMGGLSTPMLLSTGENHEVTLFSYLLLLDVAVLVLVALRPWSRLLFAAFAGTVLLYAGWWSDYYTHPQFGWTTFFLSVFFLIFAFAPRLARVDLEDGVPHSRWDNLALAVLPIVNAALGFIAYYALFDWSRGDWAGAWLAVGFAAFYLLLLRLPASGRLQTSPALLSDLHLTAAVVFLTIAIPLKAQGRWLTIGWLAEGAALLWVASRVRSRLLRVLALLCLALGFFALLIVNPSASTTPFLNERFGAYCAGIAVFAFAAWVAIKAKPEVSTENAGPWPAIAAGALLAVSALILIAVSLEIHSFWWDRHWSWDWRRMEQHRMYAQFTYSAWFMVFGAMLLATGFWRRSAFLRWQALVLLAVTIAKVFLADMSALSEGYRILSFLGLGALLLAVSFVYQRDWLNLRGAGRAESGQDGQTP